MFKLVVPNDFIKEVKKFPKEVRRRVREKLILIEKSPFDEVQKLGGFKLYKARIGKYRIILIIDLKSRLIYPMSLDLRKKSYKQLSKRKEKELFKKVGL